MVIVINSKKHGKKEVFVDDEDYDLIKDHIWSLNKKYYRFYAETRINGKIVRMHRLIMDCTDPKIQVDHINHNGLDNRRRNLRLATGTQNLGNKRKHRKTSSTFKGITWDKRRKKWLAQIVHNKQHYHLGRFDKEQDAARAYDEKARQLFGEFAFTNKEIFGDY